MTKVFKVLNLHWFEKMISLLSSQYDVSIEYFSWNLDKNQIKLILSEISDFMISKYVNYLKKLYEKDFKRDFS
jgi:hypothetical protein